MRIEINNIATEVEFGKTIIDVADSLNIPIPRFCYHKKLSVAANCRMCLVEVENIGKPVPACATPVSEGMRIFTKSPGAIHAQKSVMEFLLINHPLDCPICDQGGECDLQDVAMTYGKNESRYQEEKRIVVNKNVGPLISTDMTRCIQCTRCVRFLKEVGGMTELGLVGRGEHVEIDTYVGRSLNSELSGNIIDVCPVGALTSKPFRYTARNWQLSDHLSISPHDAFGSHLKMQVKDGKIMRVLPQEKESINQCWLSDRDRFSYQGLNSTDRLKTPLIKVSGKWQETDWETAFHEVSRQLRDIANIDGNNLGFLLGPHTTMEEGYLAKKIAMALDCHNIDHRLRKRDFRLDDCTQGVAWMGCNITDIPKMNRFLIIGSQLRTECPLLAERIRYATSKEAEVSFINSIKNDSLIPATYEIACHPEQISLYLAQILKALSTSRRLSLCLPKSLNELLAQVTVGEEASKIANHLVGLGEDVDLVYPKPIVLLGALAQQDKNYAEIYSLAEAISALCGATFGIIPTTANQVGLNLISALPTKDGLNAKTMLEQPRKGYVLLNVEPELDSAFPHKINHALAQAQFVVALSPFFSESLRHADIILPITPFSETSGTFMSMEGRVQSFSPAVAPLGQSRPAWKVLRVLANHLNLDGFDFENSQDIKQALFDGKKPSHVVWNKLNNNLKDLVEIKKEVLIGNKQQSLQLLYEVPLYRADSIVRRATALQKINLPIIASMSTSLMKRLGIAEGDKITLQQGETKTVLTAKPDSAIVSELIKIPAGVMETVNLDMNAEAIHLSLFQEFAS